MGDFTERLREMGEHPCRAHLEMGSDLREAADRIEALEEALNAMLLSFEESAYACSRCVKECGPVKAVNECHDIARQALGEGQ